jgi:hypothetical protein
VNGRAEKLPFARLALLAQCEDVHLVAAGEALDQPELAGDDPVHAASVYAAGNDEGKLHGYPTRVS